MYPPEWWWAERQASGVDIENVDTHDNNNDDNETNDTNYNDTTAGIGDPG